MKKTSLLLSLTLAGSLAVTPAVAAGLFEDVTDQHWFAKNVAAAYDLGLMQGTGPQLFKPYGEVTLGSAVAMAARLHADYHGDKEAVFDQSTGDNWYDTYVSYGIDKGFLSAEAEHDYEAASTRAQLAALLHAALPDEGWANINAIPNGKIPDVDMGDDYAGAIYALYGAGVLTGSDKDNAFLPDLSVTRAEAAVIISRAADASLRVKFTLSDSSTGDGNGSGTVPPPSTPPETPDVPETPAPSPTPTPTPTPSPSPSNKPVMPDVPNTPEPEPTPPPAETPDASGEAQAILNLVNAARAENGVSPLTLDQQMVTAGNVRATEIVGTFSHTRPDGSSFSTALTQAGVSFRGWGENIAWGQPTPQAVMDTWMNSSGHRANILSPNFSRLGVGVYESGGRMYWVQLFCD